MLKLFHTLTVLSLLCLAIRVDAQDSFVTRYHLKEGTGLHYYLKVYRAPSYSKRGALHEVEDSVEAKVTFEVVEADTSGVMTINATVNANMEGISGHPGHDLTFAQLPLPPRSYIQLQPDGRCKFATVVENDSLLKVSKELSHKASGHFVPVLKDGALARRFAAIFFPGYGKNAFRKDGEIELDSSDINGDGRIERLKSVAGQQDKKLVAVKENEHGHWVDTMLVTGPGNFNGVPVFKIEHRLTERGGRYEKFTGGKTGHHELNDTHRIKTSYYRIEDGALIARDIDEEIDHGNTRWHDITTIRLQ
jgi:hypothetical protein